MNGIRMEAGVVPGSISQLIEYPDDQIWIRAAGQGDVQVVEYWSTDREGPPAHYHPWDEIEMVIEGEVEFQVDGKWTRGGPGTVQLVPRSVSHAVRVPEGTARLVMVTIGPPYDRFARDMAGLFAAGAPLAEVARVAATHGVRLAGESGSSTVD
jgi:mannose-6-phosphate isomerase-like protein (cupin superfamily)